MRTNPIFLIGLLSLLTVSAAAQNRVSIGITAAPVVSHVSSRFLASVPDQNGQLYQQAFDTKSTTGGYLVGIPIQYTITPKWSISSGVWFSQFRSTGAYPFSVSGVATSPNAHIISSYYSIPLTLNYRLTTRRLSPYFTAGALGNLRGNVTFKPDAGTGANDVTLKSGNKPLSVRALLGAGVAYRVNTHWSLTAQPLLIWYFKPNNTYERYVRYQINGQVQLLYSL